MDAAEANTDICRVCHSEGLPERPLFHPCICRGSMKWVHQDCLLEWLRHSRRKTCEICSYRYRMTPIYSPDMPDRIPVRELAAALLCLISNSAGPFLRYLLVEVLFLVIVPIATGRMYRVLLAETPAAILALPSDLVRLEILAEDFHRGYLVMVCAQFAFFVAQQLDLYPIPNGRRPDRLRMRIAVVPVEENNNIPEEVGNVQAVAGAQPQGSPAEFPEGDAADGGED